MARRYREDRAVTASTGALAVDHDWLDRSHETVRIVNSNPPIDMAGAEYAVRELLIALGQDPDGEHLRRTPHRVARAYAELLTPQEFELTTFANDEGYDQLVLARDIPFQSLCEHHMLPFHGIAHVGYLPDRHIVGRHEHWPDPRVFDRLLRQVPPHDPRVDRFRLIPGQNVRRS